MQMLDQLYERLGPMLAGARFTLIERDCSVGPTTGLYLRRREPGDPLALDLSHDPSRDTVRAELWRPAGHDRPLAVLWRAEWRTPDLGHAAAAVADAVSAELGERAPR